MRRGIFYVAALIFAAMTVLPTEEVAAQRMPERRLVRKGNRQFDREKYDKSIESYSEALRLAPTCAAATYNLAGAMFRAERYDSAEKTLARLAADSSMTETERSEAAYNIGNAQFAQQRLKEALESYRQAMRLNPDDQEAKYNYAYTKRLLQEQEQQEQNQDNQNQDGDNNQDRNQDQDKQDNKNDDSRSDQNQNDQNQNDNRDQNNQNDDRSQNDQNDDASENNDNRQTQPTPSGISEQEREAMLDAIQAQEDKTQDKLKDRTGVIIRGKKNW